MRITIITQSDPFYLAPNLDYLIRSIPEHSKIVSAVVLGASPFGERSSFWGKTKKTIRIFGLSFFVKYGIKFVKNKLNPNKSVKKIFKKHKIPFIQLEKDINHIDSFNKIKSYSPDLLISIAGNQIFKKAVIDLAPKGCLNLHTALLPKYRGLMPSFWVLKNQEKETGVSVFFVDKGIDSGPILVQKRIPIGNDMTQAQLIEKSKKVGMDAIVEAIDLIYENNFQLMANPNSEMTYYPFPSKRDVIAFEKAGKKFY